MYDAHCPRQQLDPFEAASREEAGPTPPPRGLTGQLRQLRSLSLKSLEGTLPLVGYPGTTETAQVIESNRTDDDPPEGALAMMLGHGERMRSLWAEALSRLANWDERDHDDW